MRKERRIGVGLAGVAMAALAVGPEQTHSSSHIEHNQSAPTVIAPGFQDKSILAGLDMPTTLRFAPDGSFFVAEKKGTILKYDTLADKTPTVVADLSKRVMNFWDRGMLGLEIDKRDPNTLYAIYTVDAPIGKEPPVYNDACPDPTGKGCVVDGELDKLTLNPDTKKMTDRKQLLRGKFPQQYPSHSIGSVVNGPDGKLYVGAGDGASFNFVDFGQVASTPPMGDPPKEGGALRAQTNRTLDGGITRVDPDTGKTTIVVKGLRNPFRFTFRPGTNENWIGDVGWGTWEEINRDTNVTDAIGSNFGWPCYEGKDRQPGYDGANIPICENLYTKGSKGVAAPYLQYNHDRKSASISGLAFNAGNAFPTDLKGALFYADYAKHIINAIPLGANKLHDIKRIQSIQTEVSPVDLLLGPNGNLYYPDINKGEIHEISYPSVNRVPDAVITTDKKFGSLPLSVEMDCSKSSDADAEDQGKLRCDWDTDGDGKFDTTGSSIHKTYTISENVTVTLRVTDPKGGLETTKEILYPGDTPPDPHISLPSDGQTFVPGQEVLYSGTAPDAEEGNIPSDRIKWTAIIDHCPSDCHEHVLLENTGKAGKFTFPEHGSPKEYKLRIRETATDSRGLSATSTVTIMKAE